MNTATHHLGALSESLAMAFLLKRGYEVFRNVSAHGPIDLVAVHSRTGEIRYYDVKTRRSTSGSKLTADQIRIGVRLLLVEPELGVVSEHDSEFTKTVATERMIKLASDGAA